AGWPYQFSWSSWTPFINSQIAAMKASPYYSSISAYEPWNESDNTWRSANGTYESFWTTTFRQIRSLDATKPIQGPSFSDNLTGKGGSPNAAYWLYTWYAAMSGNMVVTNAPAETGIDGLASVPSGNNQVSVIVGGCSGSCAVTVNGLSSLNLGSSVSVKVEQTASLGRTVASSGPSTISTTTYTPSNGS